MQVRDKESNTGGPMLLCNRCYRPLNGEYHYCPHCGKYYCHRHIRDHRCLKGRLDVQPEDVQRGGQRS